MVHGLAHVLVVFYAQQQIVKWNFVFHFTTNMLRVGGVRKLMVNTVVKRTVKALIRLRECADRSGLSFSTYAKGLFRKVPFI